MKALSIKQPYASLIAEGKKTIETRKWQTKYRGDILICAGKKRDEQAMFLFDKNVNARKELAIEGSLYDRPLGAALCIAELYEIKPMAREDRRAALCNLYPGAYSWFLRNIRRVEPFEVKGALSLFEAPEELIKVVK
jgi:hypothetical protein